jgi:hypothetical protein
MGTCQGPECDRETERRYCEAHRKQLARRGVLTPIQPPMSPEEAALMAGNEWLEADEEDEYRRARTRFLMATERWLRAQGWRPPTKAKAAQYCVGLVQLQLPLKVRRISSRTRIQSGA